MATTKFFRVVDGPINIRQQPDTEAPRVSGQLQNGQQVEVMPASRTVNDGYVWWQHQLGWSAESTADSAKIFMQEVIPETDKAKGTAVVNTPEAATITLPTGVKIERTVLFQQIPVRLDATAWLQYFGNTVFAYNLGNDRNPSRQRMYYYCQGLHGGIDFGNNTSGAAIVAGVSGIIQKVERGGKSYLPNCVRVTNGDYTVIYGHVGKLPNALAAGQAVTPGMQLGEIETTQFHLHLEVRYKNTWIINPLLFMPPDMSAAILAKFSRFNTAFYSDATWTQWQTPFDQPILKSSTPDKAVILGPRAARG
jgi:hypothetical protein